MAERTLLFAVVTEGREYRIFTNGEIEGFGENAIVSNYFDLLVARAFQEREHHQQPDSPCLEVGENKA